MRPNTPQPVCRCISFSSAMVVLLDISGEFVATRVSEARGRGAHWSKDVDRALQGLELSLQNGSPESI